MVRCRCLDCCIDHKLQSVELVLGKVYSLKKCLGRCYKLVVLVWGCCKQRNLAPGLKSISKNILAITNRAFYISADKYSIMREKGEIII